MAWKASCILIKLTLERASGVKMLSDLNRTIFDLWFFLKYSSSHLWFVLYSESAGIHKWLALLS